LRTIVLGFERGEIDVDCFHALERCQPHFGGRIARRRGEAALRQAAVQRHLAALEANLVVAARARALALVAEAGGLAPAGADTTPDAVAALLGAPSGLEYVQAHGAIPPPGPGS
jgi:hypothetical protein